MGVPDGDGDAEDAERLLSRNEGTQSLIPDLNEHDFRHCETPLSGCMRFRFSRIASCVIVG